MICLRGTYSSSSTIMQLKLLLALPLAQAAAPFSCDSATAASSAADYGHPCNSVESDGDIDIYCKRGLTAAADPLTTVEKACALKMLGLIQNFDAVAEADLCEKYSAANTALVSHSKML